MDTNQPTPDTPVATPVSRGLFGTNIPTTIAFVIAILLFFMPFIDIKCNNMTIQSVTGFQLATGFKMKESGSDNSLFNNNRNDEGNRRMSKEGDNKDPNLYAILALGLGVLGFGLSVTKSKVAMGGTMVMGIVAVGMMIALYLDIKKEVNADVPARSSGNDISRGIADIGKTVTENLGIAVDFTPWFYIAAIAFLAAAYFSYKRLTPKK